MTLRRLESLEAISWIAESVLPAGQDVSTVAHCVPPRFPAYAKLFHPIREDLSVTDTTTTWDAVEKADIDRDPEVLPDQAKWLLANSTLAYGGALAGSAARRVSWASLAARYGLRVTPTLTGPSFTRRFGWSWPRHLHEPAEGKLDAATCAALARALGRADSECTFHLCCLATRSWQADLVFQGSLGDATLFPEAVPDARCTPTHWFPADRSWFVCTDYDLTFTLVGGSEALIASLLLDVELECIRVQSSTRVGDAGDLANIGEG